MSTNSHSARPAILVVGAGGFIGGFIVAALREQGHRVLCGVRGAGRDLHEDEYAIDLANLPAADALHEVLGEIDTVINVAGILREQGGQHFDSIHTQGPMALAQACVEAGVRRFVQLSALGLPEDGAFIASKHRFDERLLELPLQSVVLRPSVVYATSGSYGGTSLLRALAALPGGQWLPGNGEWLIQPVCVEDLGRLVVKALHVAPGVYEVGGPSVMTLRAYQRAWRRWLRIDGMREIHVPEILVDAQVAIFERLGGGPLGSTMWRMLKRGNTLSHGALDHLHQAFGFAPRALDEVLALRPAQVQDRWQAQLYFLVPGLRVALVILWLLSAWVGLAAESARIEQMVEGSWLASTAPVAVARACGVLDLVLGGLLAVGWRQRWTLLLMALSVLAYTVLFGFGVPEAWFDPLGGLVKNVVILPALAIAWVLADRR